MKKEKKVPDTGLGASDYLPAFRTAIALFLLTAILGQGCRNNQDTLPKAVRKTCGQEVSVKIGNRDWKVPLCREEVSPDFKSAITRAIIIVPGTDRNAASQFSTVAKLEKRDPETDRKTVVQATQFLVSRDVRRHHLPPDYLYWENGWEGWKYGYPARNEEAEKTPISSFQIMDTLIRNLLVTYPNVEKIVLAGHSAGGQFVNRYAALGRMEQLLPKGVSLHYLIANPSSYLYMSAERKQENGKFSRLSPADSTQCPGYNDYKFGLEGIEDLPYLSQTATRTIPVFYGQKRITYLLGEKDTNPRHKSLDRSCEANVQGGNRFERGRIFYQYLEHYYGPGIHQNQNLITIPDAGHSFTRTFTSEQGTSYLFKY